jgi:hypothetical protein
MSRNQGFIGVWFIMDSRSKEIATVGIMICDILTGDQNHPIAGTRGKRSRRVGNRRIGVSSDKELMQVGIAIRDFPIGSKPSKQQGHMERDPGESEFRISGFPES